MSMRVSRREICMWDCLEEDVHAHGNFQDRMPMWNLEEFVHARGNASRMLSMHMRIRRRYPFG